LWACHVSGSSAASEILCAAARGDLAEVQRLVGQNRRLLNATVSTSSEQDRTPLLHACRRGHVEVVRWLLDRGAVAGNFALSIALDEGHTPVVRLLLERRANITGETTLVRASGKGQLEIVRCALAHPKGAALTNLQGDSGVTALAKAATNQHVGVVRALLDKGADPTLARRLLGHHPAGKGQADEPPCVRRGAGGEGLAPSH
jgi:ankyrin repeat protein